MAAHPIKKLQTVHGDIRHLENPLKFLCNTFEVHGDIRHLETIGRSVLP